MLVTLDIPPGAYRNGTEYQSKGRWRDVNLVRWYEGQMRPVSGWRGSSVSGDVSLLQYMRGAMGWQDNSANRWCIFGSYTGLWVMNLTTLEITDIEGTALSGVQDNSGFTPASMWHFATFGELPLGCLQGDGTIYEWDLNTANNVTAVSGAPTSNDGMFVTPERFVFALGAGGELRRVEWCDREDRTTWTPASTNQAGGYNLEGAGRLMFGLSLRSASLIVSETNAYVATYIGYPEVYRFDLVGQCSCVGSRAGVAVDDAAYWMGRNGFFVYRGGYLDELPCDVHDFLFNTDLKAGQETKVYAWHYKEFDEVWWLYESTGGTDIDAYVAYNYRLGHWHYGDQPFSAMVDREPYDRVLAFRAEPGSITVNNSNFSSGANWTLGTNWQITGGVANQTSFTVSSIDQALSGATENRYYTVQFDTLNHTTGNLQVILGGDSGSSGTSSDTHYVTLLANSATPTLQFQAVNSFDGDLDNVSVYEARVCELNNVPSSSFTHDGATPHAETGPLEIGNGERRVHVLRVIPDEQDQGELSLTFKHREYPTSSETAESAVTAANPTDVRFSGREFRMRVEPGSQVDWRSGVYRLEVRTGGER